MNHHSDPAPETEPAAVARYRRSLSALLVGAACVYVAFQCWLHHEVLLWSFDALVLLAIGGISAASLAGRASLPPSPRAAIVFVLAALVILPSPGALLVATLAAFAGGGSGAGGAHRRGPAVMAGWIVAIAIGQFYAEVLGWPADLASAATMVRLLMLYVVAQGFSIALTLTLEPDARDALLGSAAPSWRVVAAEVLTVPCAWYLALSVAAGHGLVALTLSALIIGAATALGRFEQRNEALERVLAERDARQHELQIVHEVSREILGTLDPLRVLQLLERRCRRLVTVDACVVVLLDRDASQPCSVWSRRRGGRGILLPHGPIDGLIGQVVESGEPLCVDDLDATGGELLTSPTVGDGMARSALLVPLVVDSQVRGVLALTSRRAAAYDEAGTTVVWTVAQQAAVALENARNYRMATVDSLTGFYLRDYFFRRLEEEYERTSRYRSGFALLMVDVDGFKQVNDRHGHLAGDTMLREIAEAIRAELRAADIACRYGGDEFCVLLPETDVAGAQVIAERIRESVARRVVGVEGIVVRGTVSIGVAALPEHETGSLQGLLRRADEALYDAKRAGRDRVAPFAA